MNTKTNTDTDDDIQAVESVSLLGDHDGIMDDDLFDLLGDPDEK